MSSTHIPGFSAEASLHASEERYRMAYFFTSITAGGKVLPQALSCSPCIEGRQVCCFTGPGIHPDLCLLRGCSPSVPPHCGNSNTQEGCQCQGGIWTGKRCIFE
jgi:hypothetical protein